MRGVKKESGKVQKERLQEETEEKDFLSIII